MIVREEWEGNIPIEKFQQFLLVLRQQKKTKNNKMFYRLITVFIKYFEKIKVL